MKRNILTLLCFLWCFSPSAQNIDAPGTDTYINDLEKEIASNIFNSQIFSDTVTFEVKGQVTKTIKEKAKKENWNKVRVLFNGTDYVVNRYDSRNNTTALKVAGLTAYYELKNHKHIYIIGVNKPGQNITDPGSEITASSGCTTSLVLRIGSSVHFPACFALHHFADQRRTFFIL